MCSADDGSESKASTAAEEGGAWRPRAHRRRTRQAPELAGVARGLGATYGWTGSLRSSATFGQVGGLLRLGRGRTVVLGSHISRIDTRAVNLHGHPDAAGGPGQLPRVRGRTPWLPPAGRSVHRPEATDPTSPPLAPPPRPRRRGRCLTASRGGRCPPRGPPTVRGHPCAGSSRRERPSSRRGPTVPRPSAPAPRDRGPARRARPGQIRGGLSATAAGRATGRRRSTARSSSNLPCAAATSRAAPPASSAVIRAAAGLTIRAVAVRGVVGGR